MDKETFRHITNEIGDTLIVPSFGVGSKGWTKENKWLRSLHLDKDGKPISVGYPKFLNLGEGDPSTSLRVDLKDIIDDKNPIATTKLDGSLIIRYVRDGKVCFRTRGSLTVGIDSWLIDLPIFERQYPKLFNPKAFNDACLLMEYVSPLNQIVIKYEKPELVLTGMVFGLKENEPYLGIMETVKLASKMMDIPCTKWFSLDDEDHVNLLISSIKSSNDEGFVIRIRNGQTLVKVKSDWYLKLHTLKSKLNTKTMVDVWLADGKKDFSAFCTMIETNYDWETMTHCLPVVSAMFDGITHIRRKMAHIKSYVAYHKDHNSTRADFANAMKLRLPEAELTIAFLMFDNKEIPDKIWAKLVNQKAKYVDKSMFCE